MVVGWRIAALMFGPVTWSGPGGGGIAAFITMAAIVLLPCGGVPARAAELPEQYCARIGVDDTPRPIPQSLVPAARRLFGLAAPAEAIERMTVFRCMGGAVLVCNLGANLPCGKANTDRTLPGASRYCRDNPGAPFIPMFVTGHDTVYRWRCSGHEAIAEGPVEAVDPRGFVARLWKQAD